VTSLATPRCRAAPRTPLSGPRAPAAARAAGAGAAGANLLLRCDADACRELREVLVRGDAAARAAMQGVSAPTGRRARPFIRSPVAAHRSRAVARAGRQQQRHKGRRTATERRVTCSNAAPVGRRRAAGWHESP